MTEPHSLASPPVAAAAPGPTTAARSTFTLAVAATATLLVLAVFAGQVTTVGETAKSLGAGVGGQTWALSAMSLGLAATLLPIGAIADELGRTPAQVTLRWHVQRASIVFPKSTTPARIEENMHIFDFELSADQMAQIDGLDQGEAGRTGPHPDTMSWIPG